MSIANIVTSVEYRSAPTPEASALTDKVVELMEIPRLRQFLFDCLRHSIEDIHPKLIRLLSGKTPAEQSLILAECGWSVKYIGQKMISLLAIAIKQSVNNGHPTPAGIKKVDEAKVMNFLNHGGWGQRLAAQECRVTNSLEPEQSSSSSSEQPYSAELLR
jgi:hypothetical protein